MRLAIQDLLPSYFDSSAIKDSGVWGKQLVFEKGEYVKIVAPSGKGKSSLISFLYGIRNDYHGTIIYGGRDLRNFTMEDLARIRREHISIVFQDLRLFSGETSEKNVEIKRQVNPFHPPEKIKEMFERLGMADKRDAISGNCSYGEQQRIAIIRSLMQPFDILLLDEPFSHLDSVNAEKAMTLILEECRLRKATVIFADLERVDYFPSTRLLHL